MQAAWNQHGEASFEYETLEEFDPDLSPYRLQRLFSERKQHWKAASGPASCC